MCNECETCKAPHDGSYGSGRFCSSKCARAFSTKAKRAEINEKLSTHGKAHKSPNLKPRTFSEEDRKKGATATSVRSREERERVYQTWKTSGVLDTKSKNLERKAKELLIEFEGGAKCSICGWDNINPVTGTCPIEMDHVNGISDDNRYENVRLICPNCHSLQPTHRWLNANKGRGRRGPTGTRH